MATVPSADVMNRLLDPIAACLTVEIAERIVNLRLDEATQARLDELAAKANEGLLTSNERSEYEELVEGIDMVGVFKAKARLALARQVP